jgi:hypothetical protein
LSNGRPACHIEGNTPRSAAALESYLTGVPAVNSYSARNHFCLLRGHATAGDDQNSGMA